ncbi:unnamed protein product [Darwinula stevensoni]|uniref:Conserved oligomeric Golgi complex subunit 3 n=1 Tax=Darwinula stevensoni TaxID=69355 RepID=A0A7R8X6C0_9CRUS|nr:unnamed protein product [Darwinula stevensoni]CAG0887918.1 unnamed protein product [Darwinula stevensoni]
MEEITATVLVTGASGYVANHVVKVLLEHGYKVRGSVRSKESSKAKALYSLAGEAFEDQLELVEADLFNDESWISPVKYDSMTLQLLLSSSPPQTPPFPTPPPSPSPCIAAEAFAKKGEGGRGRGITVLRERGSLHTPFDCHPFHILLDCHPFHIPSTAVPPSVPVYRRLIAVSFVGKLTTPEKGMLTEEDWTDTTDPKCDGYYKSKTLAEKAAWDFVKTTQEGNKFELATINPSLVLGPLLTKTAGDATSPQVTHTLPAPRFLRPSACNFSPQILKSVLTREFPLCPRLALQICDVRDVALAHLKAMTTPEAKGHRHIVYTGSIWMQDFAKILHDEFAQYGYKPPTGAMPKWVAWMASCVEKQMKRFIYPRWGQELHYDNSRLRNVLKIEPTEIKRSVIDMGHNLIQNGIVHKTSKELIENTLAAKPQKLSATEHGQLTELLVQKQEQLQATLKVAKEQAGIREKMLLLQAEVERQDQEIRLLQKHLKDAEQLLATAIYQAKQKLASINRGSKRPVNSEDLIKYAHRISSTNAVAAPLNWQQGDPRRPYPTDIEMRLGFLGRLSDLPISGAGLLKSQASIPDGNIPPKPHPPHHPDLPVSTPGPGGYPWHPDLHVTAGGLPPGQGQGHPLPDKAHKDNVEDVEVMSTDSSSSSSSDSHGSSRLTDVGVLERVQEWEHPAHPRAPLSSEQRDAILELTSISGTRPFPPNLPMEDSQVQVPATPLSPEPRSPGVSISSESGFVTSFADFELGDRTIDNAQERPDRLLTPTTSIPIKRLRVLLTFHHICYNALQFLTWYGEVEKEMVEEEDAAHGEYVEALGRQRDGCQALLDEVQLALDQLLSLSTQYDFVSNKTNSLHQACEHLVADQMELSRHAETIESRLRYFEELDEIVQRLSSPTLSVHNDAFVPTLTKLDQCISYMQAHPKFKESGIYLAKFRACQTKALELIRTYVTATLRATRERVAPPKDTILDLDTAFTPFYGKFRAHAPKIKDLMHEIEQRSDDNDQYKELVRECHECFVLQREWLLTPVVRAKLNQLVASHPKDQCGLVRSGCGTLAHLCQDETNLFFQFFSKESEIFEKFLDGQCTLLYDVLRPMFVHIRHLETLAELCSILRSEIIHEHVRTSPVAMTAFEMVVVQMLQDIQERLVYCSHIYIQSDILGYNPAPGDLAYPEKLEMMQSIAESLVREEQEKEAMLRGSSVSAENDHPSLNGMSTPVYRPASGASTPRSKTGNSPADLHGMWYPTVRRTIVMLSKLYRCLDKATFQGISQEALQFCVQSLSNAGSQIAQRRSIIDAQLFQIKHLLILREQIAPFHVEFAVKETSLDFSKVKTAALGLLQKRGQLFTLGSNNAILEFLLEGTPEVHEYLLDSKKEVDQRLKRGCEAFIDTVSRILLAPVHALFEKLMVHRAASPKDRSSSPHIIQNQTKSEGEGSWRGEAWAHPQEVHKVVADGQALLKSQVPAILKSLKLYLANRDTEMILFRPVRSNVVSAYQQLHNVIGGNYNEEEQRQIECPTQEEVNQFISSFLS